MKPIYAIVPINVHGRNYQAGDEIECGSGARVSLLRMSQASEKKPEKGSEQVVPEGDTPLDETEMDLSAINALKKNGILSVEQLYGYLDSGKDLTELTGIGKPSAEKILEVLTAGNQPEE